MSVHERMQANERGVGRWQGELRYRFAAGFVGPTDVVVDAACGIGYGEPILGAGQWIGVDRIPEATIMADLEEWRPSFGFDVWVGLETLEHLNKLGPYIESAKQAEKWIVISTPIVPTMWRNEWHVRDHDADQVRAMFVDEDWYEFGMLSQVDSEGFEYGLFSFGRR